MVPGVTSGDRGNWGWKLLPAVTTPCSILWRKFRKNWCRDVELSGNGSVHEFYCLKALLFFANREEIENTSRKVLAYGIYTRVVFVSEIKRVSPANEWDFWYKNNEWEDTIRSTLHVVLCLLYTYWDIHHFGGLFILNLSKMLKFAATHHEITMKTKYQLFSRNVS